MNDLADEFLDVARQVDASLIVIGLRHRSQVGKYILGSHAQRILTQADRPVLAVKAGNSPFCGALHLFCCCRVDMKHAYQ
ncbi:nucleotide-binding universal stress UspA family protein [Arthrobacter sp. UYEF21]